MKQKSFLIIALLFIVAGRVGAQGVPAPDAEISAEDAKVTGGILRTPLLKDTLVVNPETGQEEMVSIVKDHIDIPVDELHGDVQEAVSRARARAATRASDYMEYANYYSGVSFYLYTFNYPSIDKEGKTVTLSSLFAFPYFDDDDLKKNYKFNGVVIGCHCTITSNKECPSMYVEDGYFKSDVNMMQYYASFGKGRPKKDNDDPAYYNIVVMPDYEGYGETKYNPHPYLYQELTARQVVDGTRYGLALFKAGKFVRKDDYSQTTAQKWPNCMRTDWGVITVGASQGGSVAMAVHRYIEQNGLDVRDELPMKGSVCCDGPYDPVATLRYYMSEDKASKHQAGWLTMPVAIALIVKGMLDTNPLMMGHKATEYFSEKFIRTGLFECIENKSNPSMEKTTSDITDHLKSLYSKNKDLRDLLDSDGRMNLKYALTPTAYEYFSNFPTEVPTTRGVMEDLHRALDSNNLTKNWTPKHPICLYHSKRDTVVPWVNYESAVNAFRGPGITLYLDDTSNDKDHQDACASFYFAYIDTAPDINFIRRLCGYPTN